LAVRIASERRCAERTTRGYYRWLWGSFRSEAARQEGIQSSKIISEGAAWPEYQGRSTSQSHVKASLRGKNSKGIQSSKNVPERRCAARIPRAFNSPKSFQSVAARQE
jgi:hypothetical protein